LSEPRTVTATTTSAATSLTAAAGTFNEEDAGRAITAASGINAGTTIASVTNDTTAVLSQNASASGSRTCTIGSAATLDADAARYGFRGWSPESDAESETYTVAANNAGTATPDRLTNATTEAPRVRVRT
jgi:hypothetical protein